MAIHGGIWHPLSKSKKHLHGHQHDWPDGIRFIVDEPERGFNHSCNPYAHICSAAGTYFILSKKDLTGEAEPDGTPRNHQWRVFWYRRGHRSC